MSKKPTLNIDVHEIPGSFMVMSHEPPPVHAEIMRQFQVNVATTLFTFGDVLHNPAGLEIPEDYIKHEEVHAGQHGHNPEGAGRWWARYFQDQWFRIDQEARAYAAQYDWWCANNKRWGKDRNARSKKLRELATSLSSPMYGSVVNYDGAVRLIKGFSKVK